MLIIRLIQIYSIKQQNSILHKEQLFLHFKRLPLNMLKIVELQQLMIFNFAKISLWLLLIKTVSCLGGYDIEHTVHCDKISNDWSFQENLEYLWQRNIAILHDIDRFFFLICSPLIMVVQIVIIITLVKYKLYRSSPIDIICVCFVSQFITNACFFATALYMSVFSQNNPMPSSFPPFCLTTAVINTTFSILERIYLLFFLIYIVFSMKRSIKKSKWFERNTKHIIPVVITALSIVIITVFKWFGLTQLGICSITSTRNSDTQIYFPITQLLFSTAFVGFAIFTYRYFKEHMPKGGALDRRAYEQNELMTRFVSGISIILMVLSVTMLLLYLNCLNPNPALLFLTTVSNIVKVLQCVYFIIVMMFYKKIGNKLKKLFRSIFSKSTIKSSIEIHQKRLSKQQIVEIIDIGMKQKILDIQEDEDQIDFVKIIQIMTILMGIKISYKEYLYAGRNDEGALKHIFFHEETSFQISPHLIKEYQREAHILPRISLLRGKFTIFAPRVFSKLLQQDKVAQLWRSFQLMQNRDQLYKTIQSDGGKSGQFFFFTSDSKYILKTINKDEFTFFFEYLQEFYNHYSHYSNTLIAKIYGMFKIQNTDFNQHYYILLMKNIAGCNWNQIIRIYDLKGSTDDRQILTEKDYQNINQVSRSVLKDLDFIRLENQLEIGTSSAKQLRNQLHIDTQFLREMSIIDYSLLIMRVKWQNPPKQTYFWKKLNRLQSTVDPKQFYHISLIDYFQKWDLQKKSQKWWKNLFGKKDVSAQEPSVYQLRFMKFLRQITTCDSHRVSKWEQSIQKSFESRQTELFPIKQRLKYNSLTIPKQMLCANGAQN